MKQVGQQEDGQSPSAHDQWLVDGQPAFGWIPAGTHPLVQFDAPIYLFHGDARKYGAAHLEKHRHFWKKFGPSPPTWVWLKCQQPGKIFIANDSGRKIKIHLSLHPSALLVLEFRSEMKCFSVVSLHPKPHFNDGDEVGRYGAAKLHKQPVFTLKPKELPACEITIKKKTFSSSDLTESTITALSDRSPRPTLHLKKSLAITGTIKDDSNELRGEDKSSGSEN